MSSPSDRPDQVREERMRELELSSRIVPVITTAYRAGRESVEAARDIEARFELDFSKAYRWCEIVYERLEPSRKRIAVGCLALMWGGVLLLVIVGVGFLTGRTAMNRLPPVVYVQTAAGILLAAAGSIGGLHARRFARMPRERG